VFDALLDLWEEVVDVVFRWDFSLRVCGMMQVKKEGIDTVTKKQPHAENDGYFKITVKTEETFSLIFTDSIPETGALGVDPWGNTQLILLTLALLNKANLLNQSIKSAELEASRRQAWPSPDSAFEEEPFSSPVGFRGVSGGVGSDVTRVG
jgi:hypothetical protein